MICSIVLAADLPTAIIPSQGYVESRGGLPAATHMTFGVLLRKAFPDVSERTFQGVGRSLFYSGIKEHSNNPKRARKAPTTLAGPEPNVQGKIRALFGPSVCCPPARPPHLQPRGSRFEMKVCCCARLFAHPGHKLQQRLAYPSHRLQSQGR